jgi:hypothetical protein
VISSTIAEGMPLPFIARPISACVTPRGRSPEGNFESRERSRVSNGLTFVCEVPSAFGTVIAAFAAT